MLNLTEKSNIMLFKSKNKKPLPQRDIEGIKQICRLLFVDDKRFPVVNLLKESGWRNTTAIRDVDTLNQIEIKDAHMIFVDVQGVGKKLKFSDEGLGLVIALKEKYPNKKIIVYSAEAAGSVQAFHRGIDIADARLSKLADPISFINAVERFALELFSLETCVERIKKAIYNEFGQNMETEDIIKKIKNIHTKNNYSVESISKVFNLDNAGSIASIVGLFLKP